MERIIRESEHDTELNYNRIKSGTKKIKNGGYYNEG